VTTGAGARAGADRCRALIPLTGDGVELSAVVPLPSWPLEFLPQHLTCLLASRAQPKPLPALTEVAVEMDLTVAGVGL